MTERKLLTAELGFLINSLDLRQLRSLSVIVKGLPWDAKNNLYHYGSSVELMAAAQEAFMGSAPDAQGEMVIVLRDLASGYKIKTG